MDDDSVIDFTLRQTKDNGEQRFKVGVAILPRSELDKIKKRHFLTQPLEYERAATQENPYHGNLLLKGEIASQVKNMIRHTLALACKIIPREDR
ncbi:hypothetical protein MUP05_06510 [Candidatus Bathyarchaeota archaeon]|nr:hypothetical protein [Candidatus Bathyarchaeota archaeon]